jgi:hypothetical protein
VEFTVELGCDIAAEKESEELDGTARDLEVLCSKGVEAESSNDNGGELFPCQ